MKERQPGEAKKGRPGTAGLVCATDLAAVAAAPKAVTPAGVRLFWD